MDTEDTGLSLSEYGQILWKRRWFVFVPIVLASAGAILYTTPLTPRYRPQAILQVPHHLDDHGDPVSMELL